MLTDDKRKDCIIESVEALIRTTPARDITVTDICAHAHISKSTFYKFFPTKEDVFSYFYVSVNAEVMRALPEILISDASALQKYWSITRYFPARTVALGPEVVAYIAQSGFVAEEHAFIFGKEMYDPVSDTLLKKAQATGEVRSDVTPQMLHDVLHTYLAGIAMEWSKRGGSFDLIQRAFDGMMAIFGAKPDFGPDDVLGK